MMIYTSAMKRNAFNYFGAALVLFSGMILLFGRGVGLHPGWGFVVYALGVMALVLADVGNEVGRLGPGSLMALLGLYTVLAFWDFIFIVLVLAAIFVDMILGLFSLLVGLLATLLLGVYVIETLFHHDLAGVSGLESGGQALVALVVAAIFLPVSWWAFRQEENDSAIADRVVSFLERVRGALRASADAIRA